MGAYDPSLDPNNLPASSGQLPQVSSQSTTYAPQAYYGSGGSQLASGSQYNTPGYTSTQTSAVPSSGSYDPGTSYAPMASYGGGPGDQPGMGENVSAAFLNHYAEQGIPQNTNNAQTAYDQFQQSTPANMNPYYDNASRNSANAINTQMAARGSYGSSNAIGVLSNAETNLRAQQAKDEAGYGLQRAGLNGTLGGAADASGRANSADELNWVGGISDLGFKNQREEAARWQQGTNDLMQAGSIGQGIDASTGNAQIEADRDLMIQTLMAQGMSYSDAATAANNKVNDQRSDEKQAIDTGVKAATAIAMV